MRANQIALVVVLTMLALPFLLRTPDQIDIAPEEKVLVPFKAAEQLRRPVSMVVVDGGRTLLTANQRSGTISVIDTKSEQVVGEKELGGRPVDLVTDARERTLYGPPIRKTTS